MSIRFMVAIREKNGTFTVTTGSQDGDPGYTGRTLYEHYKDEAKIRELIKQGPIIRVDAEVELPKGQAHDVDAYYCRLKPEYKPVPGVSLFYFRDAPVSSGFKRPDGTLMKKKTVPFKVKNLVDWMNRRKIFVEFVYIYDLKKNHWEIYDCSTPMDPYKQELRLLKTCSRNSRGR